MNTVPQLLAARAADQPDRTAIRTLGGEELTFGGWRRRSDAVARGLLAGGVRPGEPVGLVFVHASGPDGAEARRTELPGDREMVRGRATASALHLVRRLLESRHTSA